MRKDTTDNKQCILVVDDDEDVLFLMKWTLKSEGYNTTISPDGENMMEYPDTFPARLHFTGRVSFFILK